MGIKANCIIGGGFGDEGKGLFTDYLANPHGEDCCVVRFNGGSQAGHTVVSPTGERHVFQHFGAGTFAGAATFLSKFFIVNPITFRTEYEKLEALGYTPKVYVDGRCMVSTPYDMLMNQMAEELRGTARHGSCGLGINETITRSLAEDYFSVDDFIGNHNLTKRMNRYRYDYFPNRATSLGLSIPDNYKNLFMNDNIIKRYADDIDFFKKHTVFVSEAEIVDRYENIVFEGAQGLLLDEFSRFFPNVTRSRTGLHNVIELSKAMNIDALDVHYMTRCYTTRHGAGEMPFELPEKPFKDVIDLTNFTNQWQGSLRFSHLNVDLLKEAIEKDLTENKTNDILVTPSVVMTCLDQVDGEYPFIFRGEQHSLDRIRPFFASFERMTGLELSHASFGNTRNAIDNYRK